MSEPGGWTRRDRRADAATLVGEWPPPGERERRVVALCELTGPGALVVGSAQPEADVDTGAAARRGLVVVRRTSGGGAVLVEPGAQVWVELWVPRADALWDDDVVRSGWWLGDLWVRALSSLGATGLRAHRGRLLHTAWSGAVCFAGVGPGEVTSAQRKVVGVSQRRTRDGARFQSMAMVHWAPEALVALLAPSVTGADRDPAALDGAAVGLEALLAGRGHDDARARGEGRLLTDAVGSAVLDALAGC